MDRAAPSLESLHALELRVLEGPQRGARAPLPAGQGSTIVLGPGGPSDGADIVLREPGAQVVRLRVSADVPNAMLEVELGQVQLGEQTLVAPAQTLWPQHAPLRIGSTVVAFGRACVDDWSAALPAPGADGPAPPAAAAKPTPWRRRAEVWLAATGCSVLLACGGALWIARAAASPASPPTVDAAALAAALRSSDFGTLDLVRGADGRFAVRGRVGNEAQRQKLQAWVATSIPGAALDVQVDEVLASNVAEVLRVNGVAAKTRVAAPGRIEAEVAEPDHARVKRAEDVVRRDVPGLDQLSLRNTATPRPPPTPPVPDDPGKRIASLVPGEPAYLVTADGSRYFLGAVLPSGHRVMQIAHGSVTLELNGQLQTLNF